jgi:hypothetical protein
MNGFAYTMKYLQSQTRLAFYLVSILFIVVMAVFFAVARGHITLEGQVGALAIMVTTTFGNMAATAVNHFFKPKAGSDDTNEPEPVPPLPAAAPAPPNGVSR